MRVEEPAGVFFLGLMSVSLLLGAVGGIGTLAVLIDAQHSRSAAALGFACLFAFAGSLGTAYLATSVATSLSVPPDSKIYAFAVGYGLGGAAWFFIGLRLAEFYERAVRPRRRHGTALPDRLR